ncbi:MAG: T9SS type A sorting domain-containing protein, partial [Bacteroidota bacterium]
PGFPTSTTDVTYTFISKDGEVLSIDTEETGMDIPTQGNVQGNLSWTSTNTASSVRNLNVLGFQLEEIQPNPVQDQAQVQYFLPEADQIKVLLFDQHGKLIRTLQNGKQLAGDHVLYFELDGLANGVYYTSLLAKGGVLTKRLVVQK